MSRWSFCHFPFDLIGSCYTCLSLLTQQFYLHMYLVNRFSPYQEGEEEESSIGNRGPRWYKRPCEYVAGRSRGEYNHLKRIS